MKTFISALCLFCLTAGAADVKVSDLPAATNPSTNTWFLISDMNAVTKSQKFLATNYVRQSQIDTSAKVQAILGEVYQATNATLTDLSGATPTINGDLNVTGTITNSTTQTDTLYLSSLTSTNKLLGLGASTNAMVATAAMITNTWGIFDGTTTKFVAGNGTLQTPAGGSVMSGTVSNAVATSGLLAVDSTKTNGVAATFTHVAAALATSALGLPTDPGAVLMVRPDGTLFWSSPRNTYSIQEDFDGSTTLTTFSSNVSGGSVAMQTAAGTTTNMGIALISLATGVGDRAQFNKVVNSVYGISLANGETFFETVVKTPAALGSADDEYFMFFGLANSVASGLGADAVGFRYDYATNNGAWTGLTIQNNTPATNTVASAITTDTWYRLGFVVNNDQTSVKFYQDGVPIATNTTSIPSAATGDTMAWVLKIERVSGATRTAKTATIDYVRAYKWLNNPK